MSHTLLFLFLFLFLLRLYTDVAQVIETRVSREAEAVAKKAGGRATQVADFEYYVHYVGCEERTKHTSNALARARGPGSHPALWLWLWLWLCNQSTVASTSGFLCNASQGK